LSAAWLALGENHRVLIHRGCGSSYVPWATPHGTTPTTTWPRRTASDCSTADRAGPSLPFV
jgi:hypothetical protein